MPAWRSHGSGFVFEEYTIAGNGVMPFFTQGYERLDVNQPYDWHPAEELECGAARPITTHTIGSISIRKRSR